VTPGPRRERLERIGGKDALIIDWLDDTPLEAVPLGQVADRIVAFLRERRGDPQALISWRGRNRRAPRRYRTQRDRRRADRASAPGAPAAAIHAAGVGVPARLASGSCRGQSRKQMLVASLSQADPNLSFATEPAE
jgi:hypothetical protein